MKFLGTFKVGDTIRYSVNFHDDANTTADPGSPAARHRKPDNTYANLAAPAKLDAKTGWYGGSIDTTGYAVGSHEVRISGTVDAHEVATVISFELENYDLDNLYDELLKVKKEPSSIYYLETGGDDAKDGLTPDTAKKTFAGAMAVLAQGSVLCVRGGDYGTPSEITCDKCTIIFSSGVKISSLFNDTLKISGSSNMVYCNNPELTPGVGKTALAVTGSFNAIYDAIVYGGKYGYDIAGENNVLCNCRVDSLGSEANMICFKIRGYGWHELSRCIARGRNASKGFVVSADDAACKHNMLIDCHSENNSNAGFDVEATTEDNSIISCSQHVSDGDKIDNGTRTTWVRFGIGSQILVGNAEEKDSKDIYDRIPSASIADYKADVSAVAIEANVEGHVDTSLASYDGPTEAEMTAEHAALSAEHTALPAAIDVVLSSSHGAGAWTSTTPPTAAAIADAVWDELLAGHQGLTTFGGAIRTMLALQKQNIVWDSTVFDAQGNATSMRVRLFDTAVAALAATDGGSGEGEFLTLNVTGAYTGGKLDLGKVVEA